MNPKRWHEHFTIEFKQIETRLEGSPDISTSVSLLQRALEYSILSEEKYFAWALDAYQLPLLKLAFFADRAIDGKIWQKYQNQFTWNNTRLPIAEWDGHLLVACLEPTEMHPALNTIQILCPLSGLKQLWQNYQHTSEFQLSDDLLSDESASEEVGEDAASVLPEGISVELAVGMESMDPASTDSSAKKSLLEPASAEPVDFEGLLNSNGPITKLEKTQAPALNKDASLANAADPLVQDDLTGMTGINIPPPPKSKLATPTNPPVPGPQIKREAPASREIYVLDIIQKNKAELFANETRKCFSHMRELFDRSLLLSTDNNGYFAKPVAGDDKFNPRQKVSAIPLAEPSLFKIVEKTQKSFHGSISLNEINEKFFEQCNAGQIPAHVTIVPIINNDKVIGLLMGMGEAKANTRIALQLVEREAKQLQSKLTPQKPEKVAA